MFSDQAAISPGAPAIFFRGQVVTYGELNAAAESLSLDLARQGVGPGVILGISLQRTPDLVAVLLATLKAGGAFLPLDGRTPPDRLRFMLADSGCRLVLTDAASPALGDFDGSVLELRGGALVRQTCGLAPEASAPADLAYLIHTSGSTGAPKGVMLGHGATHLIEWARSAYSPDDLSRVAATTSLSFDPSILEIFAPLSTGGAIILKENTLEAFAPDERPTLMVSVPSVLTELCRAGAIPASVKVLIAGGEPLKADLVREVFRLRPELVLQNHYGPTEATTVAAVANVPRALAGEPSIGVPVRGATVVLLDDHGQAVGDGETGEIHIGGPGLALGYLNRPELTSRCFIQGPDGRVYRTGDLGFWRGGQLYFAGRRDQQVKIRGFRVELGEVESALLKVADVEDALAVVRERAGRPQIVAYIQSSRSLSPGDVHKAVATWLPDYMLPARMVILSAFPRLVSGK
ncbi:MAG TPA: amino acid adenylation domain-containing protein, partial [Phenylobacterium sp.]